MPGWLNARGDALPERFRNRRRGCALGHQLIERIARIVSFREVDRAPSADYVAEIRHRSLALLDAEDVKQATHENICFAQLLEEPLACASRACVEDTVGDVVHFAGLLLGPPDGVRGNVDAQHLGEAAR